MLNRSLVSVYKSGSEMNTPPVFQMEDPSKEPVKYQLSIVDYMYITEENLVSCN